jgi:hypothetical protein
MANIATPDLHSWKLDEISSICADAEAGEDMTWVLGTNTPFAYAVGLSDIRVTVADEHFDCLQKLYPISRFVAAGFAGSVAIGFKMVSELQRWLGPIPAGDAVVPEDVGNKFPRFAQSIFGRFPPRTAGGRIARDIVLRRSAPRRFTRTAI